MKFFSKKKKPTAPRPICQYAETEAHKYFVSKETELYLKYGCNLNGLVVCFIRENMFPLCYHHHHRVIQWHQETNPDTNMECRSIWDINWEQQLKDSKS
jgi:hypothetical protein